MTRRPAGPLAAAAVPLLAAPFLAPAILRRDCGAAVCTLLGR